MRELLYKLQAFMYGRNGIDGFGIFLFILGIVIKNISFFTRNGFLNIIYILLYIFMLYRIFSKNIVSRKKENDIFMKYFRSAYYKATDYSSLVRERAAVKQTHKIYVCPKCRRHLKVPKGKGKIEISCPCSYKFQKKT